MKKGLLFLLVAAIVYTCFVSFKPLIKTKKVLPPAAVYPIPSEKQMGWHEMEMNAFIHFTTNTFTGLEWGFGNESNSIFNPTALDAMQWVRTLKEAGFKG